MAITAHCSVALVQIVIKKAHNASEITESGTQRITEYASRGFRALGVAIGSADGPISGTSWDAIGLLPLYDPPRHDTGETIRRCIEKVCQETRGLDGSICTGLYLPDLTQFVVYHLCTVYSVRVLFISLSTEGSKSCALCARNHAHCCTTLTCRASGMASGMAYHLCVVCNMFRMSTVSQPLCCAGVVGQDDHW